MVAALYSNPNWDEESNDRQGRVKEINEHCNKSIELIYDPSQASEEQEPDWDNPFWQAHLRSIAKTREKYGLVNPDATMQEVIDSDEEQRRALQALEARAQQRTKLDQVNGR